MRKIIPVIFLLFLVNNFISAQVTFTAETVSEECDVTSSCITVDVMNFDSIIGMQFSYEWDTSVVQLTPADYTNFLPSLFLPNEDSIAIGKLAFSWNSFSGPFSLNDGDPIIEFCFTPVGAGTSVIGFGPPFVSGAPIEVSGFDNGTLVANLPTTFNSGAVTIADTQAPTLSCPGDTTLVSNGTNVSNIGLTSLMDNCGIDSVAYTLSGATTGSGSGNASGEFFNVGTTTVTYTASDNGGNTASCSFNVILTPAPVSDTILQLIPEITVDCDNNQVSIDLIVTNFENMLGMQFGIRWDTMDLAYASHNIFIPEVGTMNVVSGNTEIFFTWAHFSINPPSTTLADSFAIFNITYDLVGTFNLPPLTFEDFSPALPILFGNEDGTMVQGVDFEFLSGFVVNTIDNTAPSFGTTCPADTSVYSDAGSCGTNVSWTEPVATDACDSNLDITNTHMPGDFFGIGASTVSYVATDDAGNSAECSFVVTVLDTIAPMIVCPNDTIVNTDAGKCSATVDGLAPVSATDNCTATPQVSWVIQPSGAFGFIDVSSSQSMEEFMLGVNTVTYTVTDPSGNTSTCSFTVTVQDMEPPSVACPPNMNLNTGSSACTVTAFVPAPAVSDNCAPDSLTYTIDGVTTELPLGTADFTYTFPVGVNTVTYILYDMAGLSDTCSFDVTITDDSAPTLVCPGDISVNTDAGACDANVTVPAPTTLTDNCGVDLLTYTINSTLDTLPLTSTSFDNTFDAGTTTVTYTAYDQNGNSATCSFTVEVNDAEGPSISCPNDTTLTLMGGGNIVVGDIAATASDQCGTATITYTLSGATTTPGPNTDDASGTAFEIGSTTVTYYANDGNGNIDSCSFAVNVTGGQLDVDCPMDATGFSDAMACGNNIFGIDPTINSDQNDITSFTHTLSGATTGSDTLTASGTFFNVGVTTVTYFFEDIFGNSVQCSFTVTITDTTPPQITCPTVDAFPSDMGECFATINIALISPPASGMFDNCGIDSVAYVLTGTTTGSGPIADLPTVYDIGTTSVTYTIFDVNGLSSSCTFDIVVNDSEGPIVTCPDDVLILVPAGTTDTVVNDIGVMFSDLCGTISSVTFTSTSGLADTLDASGNSFPVGNTTVTYEVTDEAGNATTCDFIIGVVEDSPVDLIDCPADVTACDNFVTGLAAIINVDINDLSSLSYLATGATDATGLGDISSDVSGILFNPGATIITYTAVDNMNNIDECTFILQVDDQAPQMIGCPTVPLVFPANPGQCKGDATWTEPVATDNCGIESFIASVTSPAPFPLGDTTITYVATDSAGNMTTCSFIISIVDVEPPVFDVCPPNNIVYNQQPGTCDAIVTWDSPVAIDACSNVTMDSTHASGDLFSGNTTVVYTATDEAGNSATCSFEIITADDSNPVIVDCPTDTIILADPGMCAAEYSWTPPTATDDCSMVSISCSHMPGDTFDIGITTVVCIAIDAAGNDTTCSFTVQVMDAAPPVFDFCPDNILVLATNMGECGANVFWPDPEVSDDCDTSVVLTSNFESGDFFDVGTTTVEYIATDDGGNTTTCEFSVTVEDNETPTLACGDDVTVGLDGSIIDDPSGVVTNLVATTACDSIIIFYNPPAVTENCPMFTVTHSGPNSGEAFPVGATTLVYTVEDASGNSSTCQITFNVEPLEPIQITALPGTEACVGTTITLDINDTPGATYAWTGPGGWTSTDADPTIPQESGNYAVVCTLPSGCTNSGNIDITYSEEPIFDAWGNGPICNEDIELNLSIDAGSPPVDSFFWEFPDGSIVYDEDPTIVDPGPEDGGIYTVTVFSGLCSTSENINIEVIGDFASPNIFSDCDGAICLGESCTLIGTTYNEDVFYNWTATPEDCLPANATTSEIVVSPTEVGNCVFTYWVVLDGCVSDTANFVLTVSDDPVAVADSFTTNINTPLNNFDITLNDVFNSNLGASVTLLTDPSTLRGELVLNSDGTYNYTPADGFTGIEQFLYQICHNCDAAICATALVTINVVDESCQVPNVITPNGDTMNDELIINCLEVLNNNNSEMLILNQWGDEVFYAKPYNNDWDGTWEGKPLPDGTYFYVFKLDANAEADRGYITIFR